MELNFKTLEKICKKSYITGHLENGIKGRYSSRDVFIFFLSLTPQLIDEPDKKYSFSTIEKQKDEIEKFADFKIIEDEEMKVCKLSAKEGLEIIIKQNKNQNKSNLVFDLKLRFSEIIKGTRTYYVYAVDYRKKRYLICTEGNESFIDLKIILLYLKYKDEIENIVKNEFSRQKMKEDFQINTILIKLLPKMQKCIENEIVVDRNAGYRTKNNEPVKFKGKYPPVKLIVRSCKNVYFEVFYSVLNTRVENVHYRIGRLGSDFDLNEIDENIKKIEINTLNKDRWELKNSQENDILFY